MHGLTVVVKDTIDVAGMPTRLNSRSSLDTPAAADAAVVARRRAAGAVILGKATTWELGCGVGEHQRRALGPEAVHPVDAHWFTGGSSNGSAVAVAAHLAHVALGADTGGSIRALAACCGIAGHNPTHGLLPLDGVHPHSTTLDHVGPMAGTVADLQVVNDTLLGKHEPVTFGPPALAAPGRAA